MQQSSIDRTKEFSTVVRRTLTHMYNLNSSVLTLSWHISRVVHLRAPASALQSPAGQLGPGVGPPHEKTLGWSGGETSRGTHTQIWPPQPTLSRKHKSKWRGKKSRIHKPKFQSKWQHKWSWFGQSYLVSFFTIGKFCFIQLSHCSSHVGPLLPMHPGWNPKVLDTATKQQKKRQQSQNNF